MGKDVSTELELEMQEAFSRALDRRREMGLPILKPAMHVIKRGPMKGTKVIGPAGYKVTCWMRPWEYVDLLRLKDELRWTGTLTALMKKLVRDRLPNKLQAVYPAPRVPLAERMALRRQPTRKMIAV